MKKRIIAAAVLIPVLVLVVLVAPKIVAAIVWGLLMAVGAYELLYVTGLVRHPRMVLYSALMALAISLWSNYGSERSIALLGLLVFWILLFSELMANHVKISLEMVMDCFFAGAVVPYLLSSLIRILSISSTGRYLIPIPFVVAFLSDAGAYFAGSMFGKHKLAPTVSPKKSGAAGAESAAAGAMDALLSAGLRARIGACTIGQAFFDGQLDAWCCEVTAEASVMRYAASGDEGETLTEFELRGEWK